MGDSSDERLLVLNTGWMIAYRGQTPDDKVLGGGSYVEENAFGHEAFNFAPFDGRYYGYGHSTKINIERISPNATDDQIGNVLVIWLARHPDGGTVIIGWYDNATVYRNVQPAPAESNRVQDLQECGYFATATRATLLPVEERTFVIPRMTAGWPGRYPVWYGDDQDQPEGRQQILAYIRGRIATRPPGGTPRQPDLLRRLQVEEKAVEVTTAYYAALGFSIDRQDDQNLGWDLLATKGDKRHQLEVKGQSSGTMAVELTPNEYRKMQELRTSYRVCVVTSALTDAPLLSVFAFNPQADRWEDGNGRALRIEPIIAARLTV